MSDYIETSAIVTLGHGSITNEGGVDLETLQRVDTSVDLYKNGVAKHIVMSGFKTFLNRSETEPLSVAMKEVAQQDGLPPEHILTEVKSLDTIGNAVFTKEILESNDWKDITVVTSPSHIDRSRRIFEHVLGSSYDVIMVPSKEAPRVAQGPYEMLGDALERQVLGNTMPGDDEAIYRRLQQLVPGYSAVSIPMLLGNHLRRVIMGHL